MKLIAFTKKEGEKPRFGALLDVETILDFTLSVTLANAQSAPRSFLDWLDADQPFFGLARNVYARLETLREKLRSRGAFVLKSEVKLLAPVPRPGKVICIGLNYRDHAIESNLPIPERPLFFSKFPTCVIGAGENIVLPEHSGQVDYEAELAFVIGRKAKNVKAENALEYVLGYTNFNDVSARDFQFADGQWQRGKSCDTFAPIGEFIATTDEIPDPHRLSIKLRLNGETLQNSNTEQLIFSIPEIVEYLTQTITLEPGDIIATGTPPGVGFAQKPPVYLKDGDTVEVEIENLGVLRNKVR